MVSSCNNTSPYTFADLLSLPVEPMIIKSFTIPFETIPKETPMKFRSTKLQPIFVNILQPKLGEPLPFRVYERKADAANSTDTTIIHRALSGVVVVDLPVIEKVEMTEARIDEIFTEWTMVAPESRHMNLREFFKMHAFGPQSLSKVKPPDER